MLVRKTSDASTATASGSTIATDPLDALDSAETSRNSSARASMESATSCESTHNLKSVGGRSTSTDPVPTAAAAPAPGPKICVDPSTVPAIRGNQIVDRQHAKIRQLTNDLKDKDNTIKDRDGVIAQQARKLAASETFVAGQTERLEKEKTAKAQLQRALEQEKDAHNQTKRRLAEAESINERQAHANQQQPREPATAEQQAEELAQQKIARYQTSVLYQSIVEELEEWLRNKHAYAARGWDEAGEYKRRVTRLLPYLYKTEELRHVVRELQAQVRELEAQLAAAQAASTKGSSWWGGVFGGASKFGGWAVGCVRRAAAAAAAAVSSVWAVAVATVRGV